MYKKAGCHVQPAFCFELYWTLSAVFADQDLVVEIIVFLLGFPVIDKILKEDPHGKPALFGKAAVQRAGNFLFPDELDDLRILLVADDNGLSVDLMLIAEIFYSAAYVSHTAASDEDGIDLRIFSEHLHGLAVGILRSFQNIAYITDLVTGIIILQTFYKGTLTLFMGEHVVAGDNADFRGFSHEKTQHA